MRADNCGDPLRLNSLGFELEWLRHSWIEPPHLLQVRLSLQILNREHNQQANESPGEKEQQFWPHRVSHSDPFGK